MPRIGVTSSTLSRALPVVLLTLTVGRVVPDLSGGKKGKSSMRPAL